VRGVVAGGRNGGLSERGYRAVKQVAKAVLNPVIFTFQEKSFATEPMFPHFPALVWFGA
jgi:hypothetical protein